MNNSERINELNKIAESHNSERINELNDIAKKHGGILRPRDVVERARDPENILHNAFEWNDSAAARKFRLYQARNMIRVLVEVVNVSGEEKNVTAFVSLRNDRYTDGGYRYTPTLLGTKNGRNQMLATALWELEAFQDKYQSLNELTLVFSAIRKVKRTIKKRKV